MNRIRSRIVEWRSQAITSEETKPVTRLGSHVELSLNSRAISVNRNTMFGIVELWRRSFLIL